MDTYPLENSQKKKKKYNLWDKRFQKDNFDYDAEIKTYICPLGEILYRRKTYEYKNKQRISYWTNECKNCIAKEFCCQKKNYQIIQDYGNPSKIRMQRKMETDWVPKIYKKQSKRAELPFAHIKQNMKLHEFTTTGIKKHNPWIQTIYNWTQAKKNIWRNTNKKQLKTRKKYENTKFLKIFASHPLNKKKKLESNPIWLLYFWWFPLFWEGRFF